MKLTRRRRGPEGWHPREGREGREVPSRLVRVVVQGLRVDGVAAERGAEHGGGRLLAGGQRLGRRRVRGAGGRDAGSALDAAHADAAAGGAGRPRAVHPGVLLQHLRFLVLPFRQQRVDAERDPGVPEGAAGSGHDGGALDHRPFLRPNVYHNTQRSLSVSFCPNWSRFQGALAKRSSG